MSDTAPPGAKPLRGEKGGTAADVVRLWISFTSHSIHHWQNDFSFLTHLILTHAAR